MILFDSNILIYSASEQYKDLRELLKKSAAICSIISKLEVLGYHKITTRQIHYFEAIFKVIDVLPISEEVIAQAIKYRQKNLCLSQMPLLLPLQKFSIVIYTQIMRKIMHT